jgi:hypothetical protein
MVVVITTYVKSCLPVREPDGNNVSADEDLFYFSVEY